MSTFSEKVKRQEEEAREQGIASQGGGDWYKFVEGDNRFRILSEPEMIFEKYQKGICYTDCGYEGTAKFLTFVLDRKDEKIKLAKLPYTVGDAIMGYENDEEYNFDGFPMPYDIKVNAKGAGTKEVKYTVIAGRATSEVPTATLEELEKKSSISDIVTKMKEKKKQEHVDDGSFQREQERKANLKAHLDTVRPKEGAKVAHVGSMDSMDYPEEEINPEDIHF